VPLGKQLPTIRKIAVSSSSEPSSTIVMRAKDLRLLDSEDDGTTTFRNVGKYSLNDTALHPTKHSDSWSINMGPKCCTETSVNNNHTTSRKIPEERSLINIAAEALNQDECITFYLRQKGTDSFPSVGPTRKPVRHCSATCTTDAGSNETEREGEGGQIPTKVGPPAVET
jgi:hypothetical protein